MVEGTEGSHHKEGSKKMSKDSMVCAGIDTGKHKLDIAVEGSAERLQIDDSAGAIQPCRLGCGGVEFSKSVSRQRGLRTGVASTLPAAGFHVIVFQPVQVRAYAKFVLQRPRMMGSTRP